MGNINLHKRIEQAASSKELCIANQKLEHLPSRMKLLECILENLDASYNRLSEFPRDVCTFAHLKVLNLSRNRIEKIPDNLDALKCLEKLDMSFNELICLPRSMAFMKTLRIAHFSDNHIQEFPLVCCTWPGLEVLDLSGNDIGYLPPDIAKLNASKLLLKGNKIYQIASEISRCRNLRTLSLEENCLPLSALHPDIFIKSRIVYLGLRGNIFPMRELPKIEGFYVYLQRHIEEKEKY